MAASQPKVAAVARRPTSCSVFMRPSPTSPAVAAPTFHEEGQTQKVATTIMQLSKSRRAEAVMAFLAKPFLATKVADFATTAKPTCAVGKQNRVEIRIVSLADGFIAVFRAMVADGRACYAVLDLGYEAKLPICTSITTLRLIALARGHQTEKLR